MKVVLKGRTLVVVPETDAERAELAAWKETTAGHVLFARPGAGSGLALFDLGERAEACREPLNITSRTTDPVLQLISNFAATPFELDGRPFGSVEGFWQSLKFHEGKERDRVAALAGLEARRAGDEMEYGATVHYAGRDVPVGTWEHWRLMEFACAAKFTQHAEARAALLSTGERPLTHRLRRDSRTIPGALMAEIWMRLRARLRHGMSGTKPTDALTDETAALASCEG